ncbi:MAG: VOC family protein [Promethearchaeota archaeon]
MVAFDHVAFQVGDLEKSIKFYCDICNLKLVFQSTDEAHGEKFAFLKSDGFFIELLQDLKSTRIKIGGPPHPSYCPHIAFRCEDLDKVVERLEEKNIKLLAGPMEIENKVRWLYIADLDNNIIEFVQWIKEPSRFIEV